ncbi:reverse transcriptase domain-containing protein [Tanacetum coccineum]
MADQRTMAELLCAPIEGYAEAIVVPPIPAEHFELKHSLINLVTLKQFFGFEKEDPHAHIRYFNKITSTLKYKDVPETSIKLMLFSFSIDGPTRIWIDKEPSRSILTWDDLVSKFINHFFPLSKTTNLRNEISNFNQKFEETFSVAWDRFKDLLRACLICEDIAKISRKRLKPGKHEHGNGRARKEPGESYQKSRMVNSSQPLVNLTKVPVAKPIAAETMRVMGHTNSIEYGHVFLIPRILERLAKRIDHNSLFLALYRLRTSDTMEADSLCYHPLRLGF